MIRCKLAVVRKSGGVFHVGDVVQAFDFETYLGDAVEPQGGVFVVIEVNDASAEHPEILKLTQPWMIPNLDYQLGEPDALKTIPHPDYKRKYYLQPLKSGDPFFEELLTTGRVNESIETIKSYIRERQA